MAHARSDRGDRARSCSCNLRRHRREVRKKSLKGRSLSGDQRVSQKGLRRSADLAAGSRALDLLRCRSALHVLKLCTKRSNLRKRSLLCLLFSLLHLRSALQLLHRAVLNHLRVLCHRSRRNHLQELFHLRLVKPKLRTIRAHHVCKLHGVSFRKGYAAHLCDRYLLSFNLGHRDETDFANPKRESSVCFSRCAGTNVGRDVRDFTRIKPRSPLRAGHIQATVNHARRRLLDSKLRCFSGRQDTNRPEVSSGRPVLHMLNSNRRSKLLQPLFQRRDDIVKAELQLLWVRLRCCKVPDGSVRMNLPFWKQRHPAESAIVSKVDLVRPDARTVICAVL